ncbi:MAG: MutS-related protein [Ruminococcus sp.]
MSQTISPWGGDSEGFYVLTGANNGGKTTFLRAVGLCQIMAQTGLYVPASYCEISLLDYIYTQFPQEEKNRHRHKPFHHRDKRVP